MIFIRSCFALVGDALHLGGDVFGAISRIGM